MDVQCERCKTEYEFDDALVSGRGTTVRCTNCGHQFKVRRPEPEGAEGAEEAGDRWQVRTETGQQFTFVTLRELQRAILAGQVSRDDQLRRAGAPARALGSISELEPFFQGRGADPQPAGARTSMAPTPLGTVARRSPGAWSEDVTLAQQPPPPAEDFGAGPAAPGRRKIDTLRPPTGGAPPPHQSLPPAAVPAAPPLAASIPQRPAPQTSQVPSRPTPPS